MPEQLKSEVSKANLELVNYGLVIFTWGINADDAVHNADVLEEVAKKSPFVMQIVADVLNMPIKVARSEQACALGSAMAAAVVAGIYQNTSEAQKKNGGRL